MVHMFHDRSRTAECVSYAHPDKFCDTVADAIVDAVLRGDDKVEDPLRFGSRAAIEGCAKDNLLLLAGEVTAVQLQDVASLARQIWTRNGYGMAEDLLVQNHIQRQSPELSVSSRLGGAGDQGIMVGHACDETPELMPLEYVLSRRLIRRALECRGSGLIDWLQADMKSQVTLDAAGKVARVVMALQHAEREDLLEEHERDGTPVLQLSEAARLEVVREIVQPVLSPFYGDAEPAITINGAGAFTIGGPRADAGVVGRKIVVDAYGPRVPVGGGAYSGKDPTKVDRSGAYAARNIARTIVAHGMARECMVHIAYCIGKHEPEMVTVVTEEGTDFSDWVRARFALSPWGIIERFGLWRPNGWSYQETAEHGHYGYDHYPWEQVET